MDNIIKQRMDERGLKPTPFAKSIGIPSSTIFSIYRGQVEMGRISVDTFLKIAHGLGMTAEELYYGKPPAREYSDSRQEKLNSYYEQLNDESKGVLVGVAKSYAKDAENRISKDGAEDMDDSGVASVG